MIADRNALAEQVAKLDAKPAPPKAAEAPGTVRVPVALLQKLRVAVGSYHYCLKQEVTHVGALVADADDLLTGWEQEMAPPPSG